MHENRTQNKTIHLNHMELFERAGPLKDHGYACKTRKSCQKIADRNLHRRRKV